MQSFWDIERVKWNLKTVIDLHKLLDKQITKIKNWIKESAITKNFGDIKWVYSNFVKLVPKDINEIIELYPVSDYPDIYKITLTNEALNVVTEEELFEEVTTERVTFK